MKKKDLFENVEKQGRYLASRLEGMKKKYACVGDVRYKGLFSVLELVKRQNRRGSRLLLLMERARRWESLQCI